MEKNKTKTIGIVTIYGNDNYGNRLQNYALETSIKRLGFNVETLVIAEPGEKWRLIRRKFKRLFSSGSAKKLYKARKMMAKEKEKVIKPFTDKYLNNVRYNYNDDFSKFSKIFSGSDQVWNPNFDLKKVHFLRFIEQGKRFSYAASIATESVPLKKQEKFSKYLNGFTNISVREESSVSLVEHLINREAICVVDPTMLLSKNDYLNLINQSGNPSIHTGKKYALVYSLVGLEKNLEKELLEYTQNNNMDIIQVMGNYYNEDHVIYDPIEFIDAITNAEIVITDSFHCGVFSIIMETPFIIFERTDGAKMNSRLETLLKLVSLEDRLYSGQNLSEIKEIDFNRIRALLNEKSRSSLKYLKEQLGVK